MRIRDLAYETASALDANRGRSMLTILGIVIGISAVTVLCFTEIAADMVADHGCRFFPVILCQFVLQIQNAFVRSTRSPTAGY